MVSYLHHVIDTAVTEGLKEVGGAQRRPGILGFGRRRQQGWFGQGKRAQRRARLHAREKVADARER